MLKCFLGNYVIAKKSTLLMDLGVAVGGCLLYKHYSKPGNNIRNDVEDLAEKGK